MTAPAHALAPLTSRTHPTPTFCTEGAPPRLKVQVLEGETLQGSPVRTETQSGLHPVASPVPRVLGGAPGMEDELEELCACTEERFFDPTLGPVPSTGPVPLTVEREEGEKRKEVKRQRK